jgi:hypothetical protein
MARFEECFHGALGPLTEGFSRPRTAFELSQREFIPTCSRKCDRCHVTALSRGARHASARFGAYQLLQGENYSLHVGGGAQAVSKPPTNTTKGR